MEQHNRKKGKHLKNKLKEVVYRALLNNPVSQASADIKPLWLPSLSIFLSFN